MSPSTPLVSPTTKIGPVAHDSEMIVIGRLVQSFEALNLAQQHVQPDDFFSIHHQTIVRAAFFVSYPPEDSAPLQQIVQHLRASGKLEEVGSHAYFEAVIDRTATDAVLPYHIRRIRSACAARAAMVLALQVYEAASEGREWQATVLPLHLLSTHSEKALPRAAKRSFLSAAL